VHNRRESHGFTLIEVAVVLGVLGAVLLVAATLMTGTMDSYANVASEADTIKQARHCLEMISREVRESANIDIQNQAAGAPLANVIDAVLLTSARDSSNTFNVDANNFPVPQSIILFYLNTTPEGINQLVRHQLFYIEDLNPLVPPFQLLPAPGPYNGANIVIVDGAGTMVAINRTTGGTAAVAPLRAPKILMNGSTSFDVINDLINPIEVRVTCRVTDRYGRSTTTRLSTQVQPRNI